MGALYRTAVIDELLVPFLLAALLVVPSNKVPTLLRSCGSLAGLAKVIVRTVQFRPAVPFLSGPCCNLEPMNSRGKAAF